MRQRVSLIRTLALKPSILLLDEAFDGLDPLARQKVKEELAEVDAELEVKDKEHLTDEIGDLFFALVNACRLYGIDPEAALERTNKKFIRRFNHIEQRAVEQDKSLREMSLDEMESYWQGAKQMERA